MGSPGGSYPCRSRPGPSRIWPPASMRPAADFISAAWRFVRERDRAGGSRRYGGSTSRPARRRRWPRVSTTFACPPTARRSSTRGRRPGNTPCARCACAGLDAGHRTERWASSSKGERPPYKARRDLGAGRSPGAMATQILREAWRINRDYFYATSSAPRADLEPRSPGRTPCQVVSTRPRDPQRRPEPRDPDDAQRAGRAGHSFLGGGERDCTSRSR